MLNPFACFKPEEYKCAIPGTGAYRQGQWKVIYGHIGQYAGPGNVSSDFCGLADGQLRPLFPDTYNLTLATTPPFCPSGWELGGGGVTPPPTPQSARMATSPAFSALTLRISLGVCGCLTS